MTDPDPDLLTVTPLTEPYWAALERGELHHLRCASCGNAFLPAREECPRCLSGDVAWEPTSGRGRLISWVVYRQAPLPAFADRVPYTVAVVELEEGARMISNVVGPADDLRIEMPLVLTVERDLGLPLPRFAPA